MEQKASRKKRKSKKSKDNLVFNGLVGLITVFVIGGAGSTALKYHWPFQTSFKFLDNVVGDSHILMLPSIIHIVAILGLLLTAGFVLKKYLFRTKGLLPLYAAAAALIVFFQCWSIFRISQNPSPALNWSILDPADYLERNSVAAILQLRKSDEAAVCSLLENTNRSQTVSGISADGLKFQYVPPSAHVAKVLRGNVPILCSQQGKFEIARTWAEYYPSLSWFGKECEANSTSDACAGVVRNILDFAAPVKPNWTPTNFFKKGDQFYVELVANPEKGVLFVRSVQSKNAEIRIDEIAKINADEGKPMTYKIYVFDCPASTYSSFDKDFVVKAPYWENRPVQAKELKFNPLPRSKSPVDSYYSLACK